MRVAQCTEFCLGGINDTQQEGCPPEIWNGVRVITPAQAVAELTRDIHS